MRTPPTSRVPSRLPLTKRRVGSDINGGVHPACRLLLLVPPSGCRSTRWGPPRGTSSAAPPSHPAWDAAQASPLPLGGCNELTHERPLEQPLLQSQPCESVGFHCPHPHPPSPTELQPLPSPKADPRPCGASSLSLLPAGHSCSEPGGGPGGGGRAVLSGYRCHPALRPRSPLSPGPHALTLVLLLTAGGSLM